MVDQDIESNERLHGVSEGERAFVALQVEVPAPEEFDAEKAKVLKRAGDEAFVKGAFPAAVEHYSGALRHDTSDHALWANRSAAALRTGAFQDALLDARRARTVNPRHAKVSRPFQPGIRPFHGVLGFTQNNSSQVKNRGTVSGSHAGSMFIGQYGPVTSRTAVKVELKFTATARLGRCGFV